MGIIHGETVDNTLVPFLIDSNGMIYVNVNGTIQVAGSIDISSLPALPSGSNNIGKVTNYPTGNVDGSVYKQPLNFGYSKAWFETDEGSSSGASHVYKSASTVPAGEIWIITNSNIVNYDGLCDFKFRIYDGSNSTIIKMQNNAAAGEPLNFNGFLTLPAGYNADFLIENSNSGDYLEATFAGYKMVLSAVT